ncbi:hypothetical protein QE152_g6935 [Popillia japonica]|uniref:Uncharacterized protein n=1 Tax=Popillia japonica TaxID=7064 RepID=A0AAW1MFK3_POPJA
MGFNEPFYALKVAVVLLYRGGYFTGGVYEVEEPLGAFFLTMEYMVAGGGTTRRFLLNDGIYGGWYSKWPNSRTPTT